MPRIAVDPPALNSTAGQLMSLTEEMATARAALQRVSGAAGAADDGRVSAALGSFVDNWSASVAGMDLVTSALSQTLDGSASAYTRTDATAMPGGGFAAP